MSLYVNIEKRLKNFHLKAEFECGDEFLGLLGASGSGKTMTLKCIAGIEKPDKGKIILDGKILYDSERNINLPPQLRHVGYLFQDYALFPNMTVKQNVLCGLHNEHDKSQRARILSRTLDLLQLTELVAHKPDQLSGGQAQRTALARILVNRPRFLMLDEPFSALDSHLRTKLQVLLLDLLKDYGRGVLLVTHDLGEAYNMCDRVAMLADGQLLAVRETQKFFADPESVPAAMISGCENIMKAHKAGKYSVTVPEWNAAFTTQKEVQDNLEAVGIRAHDFDVQTLQNRHKVECIREIEEPSSRIIVFRFRGQFSASESVLWRSAKDRRSENFPEELGIDTANINLLYPLH